MGRPKSNKHEEPGVKWNRIMKRLKNGDKIDPPKHPNQVGRINK